MNPNNIIPTSTYLQADLNQTTPTPNPAQNPSAPTKQPNFFQKILPTAGGILGGILGGGADIVSLGALAPLVNPITGAAAGGALGKTAENLSEGKSAGSGVLASAAENAIGSGVGGAIGKGATALMAGGAKATGALSSKLFSAQGPGIGSDLANFATQHLGINDLPTAAKFGEVMSGSTDPTLNADKGLVSKFVADVADQDKSKVDLSNLQPAMKGGSKAAQTSQSFTKTGNIATPGSNITEQLISDNGLNGMNEADGLRSQINGVLGRVDNPGSVSKADLLGMQKQIAGFASDATQAANRSGASIDLAKAKVLNGVNQQLKTSLGFDTMKVAPKDAQALADDILTNASPVHQQAAQTVAKDITDAANSEGGLTVGQVRNMESNFVGLQQSAKDAIAAKDKNFGTSTANLLPTTGALVGMGGKKSALGTLAGIATSSSKADALASNATSQLSGILGKGAASKAVPTLIRSGLIAGANLPNDVSQPSADQTLNNSGLASGGNMQPTGMPNMQASINSSPLMQAYQTALTGGMGIGSDYTQALTSLAPQAQKLEQAAPILQQLLSGYGAGGGAQGPLSGGLNQLTSLIPGSAANQYAKERTAAQSILAQLLGGQASQYAGATPSLMATPGTAAPQLQTLNSLLGTL
jgi:hypothetical protein